jgi:putative DNA primase/helicase
MSPVNGEWPKPESLTVALPDVRTIEAEWRNAHKDAVKEYKSAQERAHLDHSVWAEQYKRAVKQGRPAPVEPESSLTPPIQQRLIAVDATFESLHERLAENPGGIFVLRDELSG